MFDHLRVLGIDSGGTKTVCLLAAGNGSVLASAKGRGFAGVVDEPSVVAEGIDSLFAEIEHRVPGELSRVSAVYICLGGLNTELVERTIRSRLPRADVIARRESSGDVFSCGAKHWGFDIAVMAGTGSIAQGLSAAGEHRVIGGWGPLFHDRGSGYTIARQALRVVAECLDFGSPSAGLFRAILASPPFCSHLDGMVSGRDVCPRDMSYTERLAIKEAMKRALPELDRRAVARLFPVVVSCARMGDHDAETILKTAAGELVEMVSALTAQLDLAAPRVLPMGGVFSGDSPLGTFFHRTLSERIPGAVVVDSDFSLVRGSVLLALEMAGVTVDDSVVKRMNLSAANALAELH